MITTEIIVVPMNITLTSKKFKCPWPHLILDFHFPKLGSGFTASNLTLFQPLSLREKPLTPSSGTHVVNLHEKWNDTYFTWNAHQKYTRESANYIGDLCPRYLHIAILADTWWLSESFGVDVLPCESMCSADPSSLPRLLTDVHYISNKSLGWKCMYYVNRMPILSVCSYDRKNNYWNILFPKTHQFFIMYAD